MPPTSRYQGGPPLPPYQHQFPSHPSQPHATAHQPPSVANPAYLSQISPFAAGGLGLGGGMGAAAPGFGVDSTGFASHAARSGFQHAAQLQQQQQQHAHQPSHNLGSDRGPRPAGAAKARIRDVWKHNLEEEMNLLMYLIEDYPYVAMDTEFPGIVGRPMGGFRGKSDYHYQCLRVNVDLLKVIQIGISLFNEKGESPPDRLAKPDSHPTSRRHNPQGPIPITWQFNFKFSLKEEMYNQTSIESLQSAGIDFNLLERDGIDPRKFAALLIPSGMVCFDDVKWLSFHGGYDFGYLTKLLTDAKLPNDEYDFDCIMKKWFPKTYDVKHLMKYAVKLHNSGHLMTPTDHGSVEILQKFEQKSGLESIADALKIKRIGAAHQAGSDSLLTGKVFFQLRERIYNGEISDDHVGKVWGLGFSSMDISLPPLHSNNADASAGTGSNGNANGGGPSTPSTSNAGLATTPAQSHGANGMGLGPMTPGGGGGVFGNFFQGGR